MPDDKASRFEGFFALHRRSLLRYLARLVSSRDVAEDISQEAFARFYVAESGAVRSPRSFLYRTAHNLAMDHMRHRRVAAAEPLDEIIADTKGDEAPTPETRVAAREALQLVERAIQDLPPKCRKVFILLRFEDRSYKEIALAMSLSETMVRKYAARALEHCRARLNERKPLPEGAKSAGQTVNAVNDSSALNDAGGKR